MSRIIDGVLNKGELYAGNTPAANLKYGGQSGFMPNIGMIGADGKRYEEWVNNSDYVRKNMIPVVLSVPGFLKLLPNSKEWIETYKAVMELHYTAITGITTGLTVTTDESEIGGGGEFQETPTDVKMARSNLNYTFREKAGKAVSSFFRFCIRYGIMDENTKKPLITKFLSNLDEIGGMYTPDFFAGTILFIEPDTTQMSVVDAVIMVNVFNKGDGGREMSRDVKIAGTTKELSIDFSSITINNDGVLEFAQTILNELNVLNKIPDTDMVLPTDGIDADVKAADVGFNS